MKAEEVRIALRLAARIHRLTGGGCELCTDGGWTPKLADDHICPECARVIPNALAVATYGHPDTGTRVTVTDRGVVIVRHGPVAEAA